MKLVAIILLCLAAGCASKPPIERGVLRYEVPQFEYERN